MSVNQWFVCCCAVLVEEPSPVPLCNGDRTLSNPVDRNTNTTDGHDYKAAESHDAASASVVNVNERLRPSSVASDCNSSSADADVSSSSRSFTSNANPSSREAAPLLPQLASDDIGRSVIARPWSGTPRAECGVTTCPETWKCQGIWQLSEKNVCVRNLSKIREISEKNLEAFCCVSSSLRLHQCLVNCWGPCIVPLKDFPACEVFWTFCSKFYSMLVAVTKMYAWSG